MPGVRLDLFAQVLDVDVYRALKPLKVVSKDPIQKLRPGKCPARFSGQRATEADRKTIDRRNTEKLLSLMGDIPTEKRTARFMCWLCLADPEQVLIETHGTVEGLIAEVPVGIGGFGYDPVFFVPRLDRTVAQLDGEEKNAISHRGNAMRKLKPLLEELLQGKSGGV